MTVTRYVLRLPGLHRPVRVASVADLHNGRFDKLLPILEREGPDLVAVPGDFLDEAGHTARGFAFLRAAAERYPTFCSLGNHDVRSRVPDLAREVARTGAKLLDNDCLFHAGLWIGGLSTGFRAGQAQWKWRRPPAPDTDFLARFAALEGCRLLLCHHPEYYEPYLRPLSLDCILAGHAHGGQWRILGRGVFAPGQGLFPRYTSGLCEGRMLVSRGLCTTRRYIPRIANPRELQIVELLPAQ